MLRGSTRFSSHLLTETSHFQLEKMSHRVSVNGLYEVLSCCGQCQPLSAQSKWASDTAGRGEAVRSWKIITYMMHKEWRDSRLLEPETLKRLIVWSPHCATCLFHLILLPFFVSVSDSLWGAASWQQSKETSHLWIQITADRQVWAEGSELFTLTRRWMNLLT